MHFSMCEYSKCEYGIPTLSDVQIGVHLPEEQGSAHLFLARHHMNKRSYNEAEAHAHKCTEFVSVSAFDQISSRV